MNWQIFSTMGYLSILAWVLMILFWGLHWLTRPRRWFCHLALVFGITALVLAKVHSRTYLSRIEPDQSEQIAKHLEEMEKERRRKEQERAEDVANIRFAEDSREDFLDKAGMDAGERAYYETYGGTNANTADAGGPAWKRQRKTRDLSATDNSLESAIGAKEESTGANVESIEEEAPPEPIILPLQDVQLARRLDSLNHSFIRTLLVVGLLLLLYDYLKRFNVYSESYLPVPLPNTVVNSMTPPPPVLQQPDTSRRTVLDELRRLAKQGATFLYLSDNPETVNAGMPDKAYRWPCRQGSLEILPAVFKKKELSPEFILNALWFGRCAFAVGSKDHSERLLAQIIPLLAERKNNRARARVNVYIVWNLDEPPSETLIEDMEKLGPATNVSLFLCKN